jgi:gamma-butyrobetaine dioxygenase
MRFTSLPLSRRRFLGGSAAALGGAGWAGAILASAGGAAVPRRARAADARSLPVIEQIVAVYGGWEAKVAPPNREQGRAHAIQCAMQAEKAGADAAAITAALLHDIGHAFAAPPPAGREQAYDDHHELVGAMWLRNVFGPEVSEPVLHHVAAKRYLVATRKEYFAHLEPDSVMSLEQQGGPMSAAEIADFEKLPYSKRGVELRIWDDDAKQKNVAMPPIEHFLPRLEACLRPGFRRSS